MVGYIMSEQKQNPLIIIPNTEWVAIEFEGRERIGIISNVAALYEDFSKKPPESKLLASVKRLIGEVECKKMSEQELTEAIKQKVLELNALVDKLKGTEVSVWFSQVMPMQGVNHNPLQVTMSKTTVF